MQSGNCIRKKHVYYQNNDFFLLLNIKKVFLLVKVKLYQETKCHRDPILYSSRQYPTLRQDQTNLKVDYLVACPTLHF